MFNKIVIIGRVGSQPKLKATKTGNNMCSFSVAVNSGWGDNKTTDWYNVSVFGKQADSCGNYLSKGSLVCVSGSIQLREYEAKDGQKRMSIELTSDSVTFLNAKNDGVQSYSQPHSQQQVEDVTIPSLPEEDIPF